MRLLYTRNGRLPSTFRLMLAQLYLSIGQENVSRAYIYNHIYIIWKLKVARFSRRPPPWASAAGPDHYFRHLRLGGLPRATYTRSPSFLCEQQTPCRRRHQDDDASEDSNSRGSGFQGVHVGPLTPARSARWRRPPGRRRDAGSHWLPLLVLLGAPVPAGPRSPGRLAPCLRCGAVPPDFLDNPDVKVGNGPP